MRMDIISIRSLPWKVIYYDFNCLCGWRLCALCGDNQQEILQLKSRSSGLLIFCLPFFIFDYYRGRRRDVQGNVARHSV